MTRAILLTGGAGGLGRTMAEALLSAGHRLLVADLSEDGLADLAGAFPDTERLVTCTADLSRRDESERVAAMAVETLGQVDVLVNNAGIGPPAIRGTRPDPYKFWEVDPAMFERFYAINSSAPFRLASLLAPAMRERGWGRIVNVTTSLDSMLYLSVYGGSKASLEAHTACMARDLDGSGVSANVLIPGGMTASGMTKLSAIPAERMLKPQIMAAPILWLSSDHSNGVTGRRFVAARWDASLPDEAAAEAAGAPVAWTGFGVQGSNPAGFDKRWAK